MSDWSRWIRYVNRFIPLPLREKPPNFYLYSSSLCGGANKWHRNRVERRRTATDVPVSNDNKNLSEFRVCQTFLSLMNQKCVELQLWRSDFVSQLVRMFIFLILIIIIILISIQILPIFYYHIQCLIGCCVALIMLSPTDSFGEDIMFCPSVRPSVRPDRYCYHDISRTAWAISIKRTRIY